MKDIIINALNDAWELFKKRIPETKKEIVYNDIEYISPQSIASFIVEYKIPVNCWFGSDEQENICICYDIDIPTTDKDKDKFRKEKFSGVAWNFIYKAMINNGYKRIGFNSGLLKEFDDTSVYEMYVNKDFDRLVKYYSLSFIRE